MGHSSAVWDPRAAIEITKDWNGIDQVTLRVPRGSSARVSLHGGQVISWRNERGEELLFTSNKVSFYGFFLDCEFSLVWIFLNTLICSCVSLQLVAVCLSLPLRFCPLTHGHLLQLVLTFVVFGC
eukprot:TRINITY_DN1593_c0_g1_i2.p1 TRINITY_DN1593_c0_g1~~TRINITY_DN1593_c0_g1_i2.p1  ORF type:complete len:125 (+),score=11.20 TRINITY_DN1593_c0_g1_i2:1342-1716(+)